MSLSLDEMRSLVRRGAGGLDEDDLPDADADLLLNMSLWELEDRFPFKSKEQRYRFTMVVGQSTYNLNVLTTPIAIRSVAILTTPTDDSAANTTRMKLARMDRAWYDENVALGTDLQAQPTRYMREDNCLYFNKDPDDTYLVEVNLQEGVASLLVGTNEVTGLPRNWDELVVQGAIVRQHFYNEDYQLARQAANFQVGGVRQAVLNQAKDEGDSRYAKLNVMWEGVDAEDG